MSEWLSVTQYAEVYAITRPTVYKWIDCGLVEWYHAGRVVRVKNQPPKQTATVVAASLIPGTLAGGT